MIDIPEGGTVKRVFLEYPPDYFELSEEERMAVARGMAVELQRQLGITPKPMWSEVTVEPGEDQRR